ncbi:MAG: hypothetical protein JWP02_2690, partial [Acidimicrobiales bacterium]|nr:hypothetical protein [Acidimicrobiales bacterium]
MYTLTARRVSGPTAAFAAVVTAALVRGVGEIVRSSTLVLLHHHLADDGFYYFDLARHFPRPEVTTGVMTTGFHPLYWVLLAGPFHLSDGIPAVRAALLLLLVAHLAVGLLIFRLVARSRLGLWPAALAAGGWVASPALRQVTLMGVETPIAVLLVVAAAAVMVGGEPSRRRWALAGLLAGLAVVARVDAVFVVGVTAVERLVTWSRTSGDRRTTLSCLTTFAAIAVIITGPWVVWLALHGGVPDSARALRILRDHGVDIGPTGVVDVFGHLVSFLVTSLLPLANPPAVVRAAGAVLFVLLGYAGVRSDVGRAWYRRWRGLLVGTLVLYLLYATVLGGIREWYQLYAAAVMWLVLVPAGIAAVHHAVAARPPVERRAIGAVGLLLVCALVVGSERSFWPQEADKYLATMTARTHLPRQASVGAFNSGVYTYFLPQRVVNLDGVVNRPVQTAIEHRTLCRYLRDHDIGWYVDARASLEQLRYFARGVVITQTFDLSAEY